MRILSIGHRPASAYTAPPSDLLLQLRSYASAGTTLDVAFPEDYPESGVERALAESARLNGLDHALAAGSIVRTIVAAAHAGYDAVVANNTFDPAVDAARLAVTIPVIGPLRATMHVAATLTDRLGILVPLPSHVPHTWRLLRAMSMADVVTDVQVMETYGAYTAEQVPAIRQAATLAVRRIVDTSGAQGVIPLGGAFIPNVVDPSELAALTGVPVYNTKAISIQVAELCVRLKMTHSALSYPPAGLGLDVFTAGLQEPPEEVDPTT